MEFPLTVREATPEDLEDLEWTGGQAHLQSLVVDFGLLPSERIQVVVELPNGRLAAHGAIDFREHPGAGLIMKLSVREELQSLGLGTALIRGLERAARDQGCRTARIAVEHDNPRAGALYRRLGYAEVGDEVAHWVEGHRQIYVTVCTVLERRLDDQRN